MPIEANLHPKASLVGAEVKKAVVDRDQQKH
jgi:hypothetical protein